MEEQIQSPEPLNELAGESQRKPADIEALTSGMVKGDEMAWRAFYNIYFDRLFRYLLVVSVGNEDATREAVQAAFVRVARHIKTFADESVFWNWLTVLARSALSDETKKRRRYFSFLARFTEHASTQLDANDRRTEQQLKVLLDRHVALLSPDEQKLIEAKYFEHQSVREIANELQTTVKAVESKLSRIRRALKDAVLAEMKNEKRS